MGQNPETKADRPPFYAWLTTQGTPPSLLIPALAAYFDVEPSNLKSWLDAEQFDKLQTAFNAFWRKKAKDLMEPQFIKPGYVDAAGVPTHPAPRPNGSGYAPFVLWKRRDTDANTQITGTADPLQMQADDPVKFGRERRLATGDDSPTWSVVPPDHIEQFLQRMFDDKDLRLVRVVQAKPDGDILPTFEFHYTNRQHVRRKRTAAPRRKLAAPSEDA